MPVKKGHFQKSKNFFEKYVRKIKIKSFISLFIENDALNEFLNYEDLIAQFSELKVRKNISRHTAVCQPSSEKRGTHRPYEYLHEPFRATFDLPSSSHPHNLKTIRHTHLKFCRSYKTHCNT